MAYLAFKQIKVFFVRGFIFGLWEAITNVMQQCYK